jgi:hypothetical protein
MGQKNTFPAMAMTIILSALILSACSGCSSPAQTPSPIGGGAVVQSDSVITGKIEVLIQSSESVDSLPNPTEGKVGQVITARTDEDLNSYKAGQTITARIKYTGDVPKPGISLYIYSIAINATLGEEIALALGQSASISGEDLEVRFVEVVSDSRCPEGAICIWAGEASCLLEITESGSIYRKVLTQLGRSEPSPTDFQDYEITFDLRPYPQLGKEIESEDYRLQLTISKNAD